MEIRVGETYFKRLIVFYIPLFMFLVAMLFAERAEQVERDRKAAGKRTPALPRDRRGLEKLWEDATGEEKRELVRLVVERVEVSAGSRGKWNPDRVQVV
jgi:hypothetical protein